MQKALLIKAVLVTVIAAVLQVPLWMIDGIVRERAARQNAMVRALAEESYAPQLLAGPILSIPYTEEFDDDSAIVAGAKSIEKRKIERVARFFPSADRTEGVAAVETKSRGLFKARVFDWHASMRGEFAFNAQVDIPRSRPNSRIVWGKPIVSLLLRDPRGLSERPSMEWNETPVTIARGSGFASTAGGVHAAISEFDANAPQRLSYAMTLDLHGTETLAIVPLAATERVAIKSDWPHPSFGGQFLPEAGSLKQSAQGFDAQWNVTALASNAQQQTLAWLDGKSECRELCADRLEVRFFEPVDIYSLSDRALKYGFLFVVFTFGAFALFEVLKALPIHPLQYLLVGLALATFFLLLIALSEHVAFGVAYGLAALACVALIGFYLRAALGGMRRGVAFAALLAALYGALFGLLVSEDNALLLGSLLIFGLIATAMVLTRDFDWYSLQRRQGSAETR